MTGLEMRGRRLVATVLDRLGRAAEPLVWDELVAQVAADVGKAPRTVANTLYELVGFGAVRRVGIRRGSPRGRDRRPVELTELGRAWLAGDIVPTHGAPPTGDEL